MKFLSPEIEALYKLYYGNTNEKSLIRQSSSCGIFQDCNYSEKKPFPFYQKTQKKS
ncbi:hypothetical protein [Seonamhaeicola sediminis]|uniref:hypothetical protein n=1 Tax=Seonamhaeicola sediminis TaxID=2528206 RepID=UPI001647C53D|nr:hypothetical protein [Seonamhaeicola sediminis]